MRRPSSPRSATLKTRAQARTRGARAGLAPIWMGAVGDVLPYGAGTRPMRMLDDAGQRGRSEGCMGWAVGLHGAARQREEGRKGSASEELCCVRLRVDACKRSALPCCVPVKLAVYIPQCKWFLVKSKASSEHDEKWGCFFADSLHFSQTFQRTNLGLSVLWKPEIQ